METSKAGRALIAQREGNKLKAYSDSGGILTIGVGHTSAAGPPKVTTGMIISADESDAILSRDLAKFEAVVNDKVKVPISQDEFDALVSLAFNIGGGAFAKSTLLRKLNAGDRAGAAAQFLVWNKVKGKAVKGLTTRRQAEQRQFLGKSAPKVTRKPAPPAKPRPADDAYASKTMVMVVQERLTELGYPLGSRDPATNQFDGIIGTLTASSIRDFRADNGLPDGEAIDAALVAALDTAKPRKLAPARQQADEKVVREAVPEVRSNWLTKVGSFFAGILSLVAAAFNGILGNLGIATGYIQPVKDFVGDMPGWVWFLAIAIVAGGLFAIARHGERKGVEAFKSGARL